MKLLLVLDDAGDADFLSAALRRQSVERIDLVHVTSLAAATRFLANDAFDVVLLDLKLPDGSGPACVDAVKSANDQVPIVVLSSQDDEELAVGILQRGAQDYLVKWEGQGRTILRSIRHSIERKRAELHLSYLAQYDPLTGVPNRQFFNDQLDRAIAGAQRDQRPVAVLFLDLDEFKMINDTLGHDVGDGLLKEVAERLRGCLRGGDVVARLGGDEFGVLLEGAATPHAVESVAKAMLDSVAESCRVAGRQLRVAASIGITLYPEDHRQPEGLLKNADIAMYTAKQGGGNTYRFFHAGMQAELVAYHELARDIHVALERGEFHLAFQPKVNVHTKSLHGLEALLRWTSPVRGVVGPAQFIRVAEDSGHIIALGEWVLNEACATLRRWGDQGLRTVPVSVNVSARQFQQPGFHRRVGEILTRHGVSPALLELELTEGMIMADVHGAQRELVELKRMGLRLSIDDFGTGYSCLSYLRRFPIDTLKIDRSFVQDIGTSLDGEYIIDAILSLARSLRLQAVAEGVETHEQLNHLIDRGCHVVQGFLLGRPMESALVEPLLEALEQGDTDSTAVIRMLRGAA